MSLISDAHCPAYPSKAPSSIVFSVEGNRTLVSFTHTENATNGMTATFVADKSTLSRELQLCTAEKR